MKDLVYPVVALKSKSTMVFYRKPKDLLVAGSSSLKKGFYKNLSLVDSSGKLYKIKDAKKVGYYGIFFGFRLLYERSYKIDLIFYEGSEYIELATFKEEINNRLRSDFWQAGGNVKELHHAVENSESIAKIINFMTNYFYKDIKI